MEGRVTVSTIRLGLIINENGIKRSVVTDIEVPRLEETGNGELLERYIAPALRNLREKVECEGPIP